MAQAERVENLVLVGGEAGEYVNWALARTSRPEAVVERAPVGGNHARSEL